MPERHSTTQPLAIPESVRSITLYLDRDEARTLLVALELRRLAVRNSARDGRGVGGTSAASARVEAKIAAAVKELTDA